MAPSNTEKNKKKRRKANERKKETLFWKLVGQDLAACPLPGLPLEDHYRPLNVLYLRKPEETGPDPAQQAARSFLPDFMATQVYLKAYADDTLRTELESSLETVEKKPRKLLSADSIEAALKASAFEVGAFLGFSKCHVEELQINDWAYARIGEEKWVQIDELFRGIIGNTTALEHDDSGRRVFAVITGSHVACLERGSMKNSSGGAGLSVPATIPVSLAALLGRKTAYESSKKGVIGVQVRCYAMRQFENGEKQGKWEVSRGVPMLSTGHDLMDHRAILWLSKGDEHGILELPFIIDGATVVVDMKKLQDSDIHNDSKLKAAECAASAHTESVGSNDTDSRSLSSLSESSTSEPIQGARHWIFRVSRIMCLGIVNGSCVLLVASGLCHLYAWLVPGESEPGYIISPEIVIVSVTCALLDLISWITPLGRPNMHLRALLASQMAAHGEGMITVNPTLSVETLALEISFLVLFVTGYALYFGFSRNVSRRRHPSNGLASKREMIAALKAATAQNPFGVAVIPRNPQMLYREPFDKWVFHDTQESREAFMNLAKNISSLTMDSRDAEEETVGEHFNHVETHSDHAEVNQAGESAQIPEKPVSQSTGPVSQQPTSGEVGMGGRIKNDNDNAVTTEIVGETAREKAPAHGQATTQSGLDATAAVAQLCPPSTDSTTTYARYAHSSFSIAKNPTSKSAKRRKKRTTPGLRKQENAQLEPAPPIEVKGAEEGLTVIRANISNLQDISCSGPLDSESVKTLCDVLLQNPAANVVSLSVTGCALDKRAAGALAELLDDSKANIHSLDLRSTNLGPEGASALVQSLVSPNTRLVTLNLANNNLGDNSAPSIASLLRHTPSLKELSLASNHFRKGMKTIAPSMASCVSLKTLSLAHNDLGTKGVRILATELQEQGSALVSLDVTRTGTGSKGVEALTSWLADTKTLQTLVLAHNEICHGGAVAIASALRLNHTLRHLNLGSNKIGDHGAIALAKSLYLESLHLDCNRYLKALYLDWNSIGDEGAQAWGKALKSNSSLEMIDFSGNRFSDKGGVALSEALPYNHVLECLCLANNQLQDETAVAFAEVLMVGSNRVFQWLDCEENPMTESGRRRLAGAFRYRSNYRMWFKRTLQMDCITLDLTSRNIGDEEVIALANRLEEMSTRSILRTLHIGGKLVTSRGISALATYLKNAESCRLKRLYARDISRIDGDGDEGAKSIAVALTTNRSLFALSLTSCGITPVGAMALSAGLQDNDSLHRLILDRNSIGHEGFAALGDSLEESSSLEALSVRQNNITDEGVGKIARTHLKEVNLSGNEITDKGAINIAHACMEGGLSFERLSLSGNKLSSRGKEALAEALPPTAILYT